MSLSTATKYFLNTSRNIPFQCLTALSENIFFLVSNLKQAISLVPLFLLRKQTLLTDLNLFFLFLFFLFFCFFPFLSTYQRLYLRSYIYKVRHSVFQILLYRTIFGSMTCSTEFVCIFTKPYPACCCNSVQNILYK